MLNKIKEYFKSLQHYSVAIIDIDERGQVVSFSENGILVKASFKELGSFCHFLPFMENHDIAKFAYYLRKYIPWFKDLPELDNSAKENTVFFEAEGRGGMLICFDMAVMCKTHYKARDIILDQHILQRFTKFGSFRVGIICADYENTSAIVETPRMGCSSLRLVKS